MSVPAPCAACDGPLPAGRARQYCSPACRQDAYRRRHQPARPAAQLPARRSRRDGTVYTCGSCQSRYLGEQWCHDCNRPCQRLGAGGTCPSCEDVVLIEELTGDQSDDTPSKNLPLQDSPSTMKKSLRFQGKLSARVFGEQFFTYYNHEHRHSGIALHTPAFVHYGTDAQVRQRHQITLQAAHQAKAGSDGRRTQGGSGTADPNPQSCRPPLGSTSPARRPSYRAPRTQLSQRP